MRIAIDASSAAVPEGSGVAVYLTELVRGLAAAARPGDTFAVCCRASKFRHRARVPLPPGAAWRRALLLEPFTSLLARGLDVLHGADARLPRCRGPALVATVHDLFSLVSSEFADDRFRAKKIRRYRDLAARAHVFVVPSEHTKRDVVARLGVDPGRIAVAPLACGAGFSPQPEANVAAARARHGLPPRYILTVGIISTRKHTAGLVRAFRALRARGIAGDAALVIAGKDGFGAEETHREAAKAEKGTVILLGYTPQEDLPPLYAGATVYAFPSLYEGFGIPVLEAMASGIPVVASDRASIPEIAGDAALLVDPEDEEALARALERALADEALRAQLCARGLARAALFSWDRTARETYAAYELAVRIARER